MACVGDRIRAYRVLVGKFEGKRHLGKPRRKWVGNTKIDLQEMGWGSMEWIGLAGTYEFGNEPSGSTKCGEFLD